jgi:RimJ/RimL family protein N-acetyltransferase
MFETPRLRLRAFDDSDAPAYHAWWNDASLVPFQTTAPVRPITREDSLATLKSWVKDSLIYCSAETLAGGQLIGMVNLYGGDPKNRDYKLAIIIARPFWGHGFGREMVEFITRYAFRELGVHRISLQVAAANLRAIKCYETAGFKHEGRLRQANFANESWSDELLMGMLREDLPKSPDPS